MTVKTAAKISVILEYFFTSIASDFPLVFHVMMEPVVTVWKAARHAINNGLHFGCMKQWS